MAFNESDIPKEVLDEAVRNEAARRGIDLSDNGSYAQIKSELMDGDIFDLLVGDSPGKKLGDCTEADLMKMIETSRAKAAMHESVASALSGISK